MKRPSPLFSIFLIVLVDVLGLTIILPLLPLYAEDMGATPFVASLLVTSYAACQLVAGPILGQISDRVGRKPVLLGSQLGTFIGFLILAFANSLPVVFLSRIIDGITAGNISVAQAYVSDVSTPENRTRSFGVLGVAFGLGFLIGPAFAGVFSGLGPQAPIFAAAGLSATSIVATWLLLPSTPRPEAPTPASREPLLNARVYAAAAKSPPLATLLVEFLLFIFPFATFMSGFPLFAERRFFSGGVPFGVREIGYVLAFMGLVGVITQVGFLQRLVARYGEEKLVSAGFLCMIVGFGVLGIARSTGVLLGSIALLAFGSSILRPSITSLVSRSVGRADQGAMLGLMHSLMSIAQILAPMAGGLLIEHGRLTAWGWMAMILSAAGWALTFVYRRNRQLFPSP